MCHDWESIRALEEEEIPNRKKILNSKCLMVKRVCLTVTRILRITADDHRFYVDLTYALQMDLHGYYRWQYVETIDIKLTKMRNDHLLAMYQVWNLEF